MNSNEIEYIRSNNGAMSAEAYGLCAGEDMSTKYVVLTEAFDTAKLWYETLEDKKYSKKELKKLKKKCRHYIYSNTHFSNKPKGFISGMIWSWMASIIIQWIVKKIIEHLMSR